MLHIDSINFNNGSAGFPVHDSLKAKLVDSFNLISTQNKNFNVDLM